VTGVLRRPVESAQYTGTEFRDFCRDNGVRPSVGRTGICYDNAVAESFFATLKKELIHTRPWPTIDKLQTAVFEYIESYYNRRRRHSAIDYDTPVEYEYKHALTRLQAA
jgi:transposase InsO family protein